MKTNAQTVVDLLVANPNPQAVTLAMGYMVTRKGDRVLFSDHFGDGTWSPPSERNTKRNRAGRMTSATFVYADGSSVRYTWSELHGPQWRVQV